MIVGIGIDMALIARFERAYERFGERFCQRILGPVELEHFALSHNPARFLAMRFAAKEAASKALGTGFKQGVAPRQFEIVHAPSGKPSLRFSGRAAQLMAEFGVSGSFLSLSDEGEYAIAFAVLEREP